MRRTIETYLVVTVLVHLSVVLVHSVSHFARGILPPILDSIIISIVILAGPPITLLSLRKHRSVSLVVIAVFMAGAFVYGFNGHFYSEGADRVALDIADWTTVLFVGTAAALGVLEAIGLGLALAALSSGRRPSPAISEPA